jgi:ADP-heptose:LPS heptosyltransferase
MTTPLFRELKQSFPGARCTLVIQEAYRSIFVTNPHVDEILTVSAWLGNWLPQPAKTLLSAMFFWWKHLRHREYDVAISPRWDTDEHLATFLCLSANVATTVGYTESTTEAKRSLNRGFDSSFDVCLSPGPLQHEVLRNLAIVEAIGGSVKNTDLDIRLTSRDRRHAAQILQGFAPSSVLVALGIGAQANGRRWPLERYAQVIAELQRYFSVQTVILCGTAEREEASQLARRLAVPPIVLAGAQFRDICAILEHCDLFLGNDSGPAHLAAAMNCKTIVISRHPRSGDPNHANSPVRFAPHCSHKIVLQPGRGLDACLSACTVSGPHCITTVAVRDAVAAALEMLAPRMRTGPISRFCLPALQALPISASGMLANRHVRV